MLGQRLRVIAEITDGAADVTLEGLQRVVDERATGIRLIAARWLTIFEIHHAQVPQYRVGRAFLAGDAAHVHSPAGGQGMNTGMQDAFNLGWKLAAVVTGEADPALLDSYQTERHPVAAQVIEQTTRMTNMGTLDHRMQQLLRNTALHVAGGLPPVRRLVASQLEETDLNYRRSPIVAGQNRRSGVRPGDSAPDVGNSGLRERLVALGGGTAAAGIRRRQRRSGNSSRRCPADPGRERPDRGRRGTGRSASTRMAASRGGTASAAVTWC